eukprot:gene2226-4325_t
MSRIAITIFVINAYIRISGQLVDYSNFISVGVSLENYEAGLSYESKGYIIEAIGAFSTSYYSSPSSSTAYQLGRLTVSINPEQSKYWYEQAVLLNSTHTPSLLELGIIYHFLRDDTTALAHYSRIIEIDPLHSEAWYNRGVSYQYLGEVELSAEAYSNTLRLDPTNLRARTNLAALHQKHGDVNEAIFHYRLGLEHGANGSVPWNLMSMMRTNLGAAYGQLGMFSEAIREQRQLQTLLTSLLIQYCKEGYISDGNGDKAEYRDCMEMRDSRAVSRGHLLGNMRSCCSWNGYELLWAELVALTIRNADLNIVGPLLPFSTLQLPVSLGNRLKVAQVVSSQMISTSVIPALSPRHTTDQDFFTFQLEQEQQYGVSSQGVLPPLRLAWLSYDFNSHPTCHLAVSLLTAIRAIRDNKSYSSNGRGSDSDSDSGVLLGEGSVFPSGVLVNVYSYGKDDGSRYRQSIMQFLIIKPVPLQLADRFVDLAASSTEASASVIRADEVHILLDMQGHTMGHRLEITAARPAPIQISYLIFPGTSGASFLDYLVGDPVVSPPESAVFYSEALLLLPPSYQIPSGEDKQLRAEEGTTAASISDGGRRRRRWKTATLRRRYNLPPPSVPVLCNFNVADKLSPETFALWLQIMRRVPGSVLWLLLPHSSDRMKENSDQNTRMMSHLRGEAAFHGVSPSRIIFADRVSKAEHIRRHRAADLFVDCLVYGAHSTATDAMRGGLPVLTLLGDAYPARVGASLYAGLGSTAPVEKLMVVSSLLEFENIAVRLLNDRFSRSTTHCQRDASTIGSCMYSLSNNLPLPTSPPSPLNVVSGSAGTPALPRHGSAVGEDVLVQIETNLIEARDRGDAKRGGLFDEEATARKFVRGMQLVVDTEILFRKGVFNISRHGSVHKPHVVLLQF